MADRALLLLGTSTGGIRRHVAHLRRELPDRGWDVAVAGPAGVLDDLDHEVPLPFGNDVVAALRSRRALRAAVAGADVVHAHGLKPGWVAALTRPSPPLVVSIHNLVLPEVAGAAGPVLRWLEARLPARAAASIAISDDVAARFAGRPGADRIRVIPPAGPPPQPTRPPSHVRADLGVHDHDDLVVTPARLTPQKGLDLLLDAAELARAARPRLRWFVFGEGRLRAELEATIRARDLTDVVHLAGQRPDVDSELAAADVVAVTSVWESGPLVLLEALALGRRVVSTDVGLARRALAGGGGTVVPVGDARAFADALVRQLEAGDAGGPPARLPEDLRPEALVAAVAEVYRDVTAGRA